MVNFSIAFNRSANLSYDHQVVTHSQYSSCHHNCLFSNHIITLQWLFISNILSNLVLAKVSVPLSEHLHVGLKVDDQPHWFVDLVGGHRDGTGHQLVGDGLATVRTSQAANLTLPENEASLLIMIRCAREGKHNLSDVLIDDNTV